jgi:tRNA threonylcarbamoyladenosine biosynthesis protein TsaE
VIEITSGSPEETHRLGIQIARKMPVPGVLLLRGPLGSGKTTLARGVAVGLGVKDGSLVISPSYTLVNVYAGRCPIYHVDLYRLSGDRDIRSVGLDDFMGIEGVTIIEWSERLNHVFLPAIEVDLEEVGEQSRKLRISLRGEQARRTRTRDL